MAIWFIDAGDLADALRNESHIVSRVLAGLHLADKVVTSPLADAEITFQLRMLPSVTQHQIDTVTKVLTSLRVTRRRGIPDDEINDLLPIVRSRVSPLGAIHATTYITQVASKTHLTPVAVTSDEALLGWFLRSGIPALHPVRDEAMILLAMELPPDFY